MAKFATIFCVLLLAYGAHCLTSTISTEFQSVVDAALAALANLAAEFEAAKTSLQNAAAEAAANIQSAVQTAVENTIAEFAATVNSTVTDLYACDAAAKAEFEGILDDAATNATACVTEVTDAVTAAATNFTTQRTELAEYIAAVNQNMTACTESYTTNPSVLTFTAASGCVASLTLEAAPVIAYKQAALAATATSFASSIVSWVAQLEACASSAINTATADTAAAFAASLETCAQIVAE